jgi:type IV pilus assembly protein PilC
MQPTSHSATKRVRIHAPFGSSPGRSAEPRKSARIPELQTESDRLNGGDERAARARSRQRRLVRKASMMDVALVANDLRAMVGAGMPVGESLSVVGRGIERRSPALAAALEQVRSRIEQGKPLGDAFRPHTQLFGELFVEMVAAGEQTGRLDEHLGEIAADYEQRHKNRATIVSALVEPAIIVAAGILVAYLILAFTVPRFRELYDALSQTAELPLATKALIFVSDLLTSPLGVAIVVGLAALIFSAFILVNRHPRARYRLHRAIATAPVFGALVVRDAVGRGCRTLGVALKTIGDVPSGLRMASKTCGNLYIGGAFEAASERVRHGRAIAESLAETRAFPEMAVWMVHTGERSGSLDEMLLKLSEGYEAQVRVERERLLMMLRPTLLVVMGAFVLGLMLAMYLPVFTLVEQLQQR